MRFRVPGFFRIRENRDPKTGAGPAVDHNRTLADCGIMLLVNDRHSGISDALHERLVKKGRPIQTIVCVKGNSLDGKEAANAINAARERDIAIFTFHTGHESGIADLIKSLRNANPGIYVVIECYDPCSVQADLADIVIDKDALVRNGGDAGHLRTSLEHMLRSQPKGAAVVTSS